MILGITHADSEWYLYEQPEAYDFLDDDFFSHRRRRLCLDFCSIENGFHGKLGI